MSNSNGGRGGQLRSEGNATSAPVARGGRLWRRSEPVRSLGLRDEISLERAVTRDPMHKVVSPVEWHPLFHANATVALPLIYAVSLGAAESARDIAIELGKRKPPTQAVNSVRRPRGYRADSRAARPPIHARNRLSQRALGLFSQLGYDRSTTRGETRDRDVDYALQTRRRRWILSCQRP